MIESIILGAIGFAAAGYLLWWTRARIQAFRKGGGGGLCGSCKCSGQRACLDVTEDGKEQNSPPVSLGQRQ